MLGDCEKMVVISSSSATSGEWTPHPQNQNNQVDHEKVLGMMDSSSSGVLMENPNQEQQKQQQLQQQQQQQQQQQVPLKCPRCDSANTKFCYYNNYSLSQPRHFCKACKRYWTRGGTLRNVPVGGGCRKNKRIKRPNSTSTSHEATSSSSSAQMATSNPSCTTTATATTNNILQPHHQLDLSSSASHMNPLFYGLFANSSQHHLSPDLGNLGYPRFGNDHSQLHQASQMGDLGLGFSSGIPGGGADGGQDLMPSNMSLLSGNYSHPIFGSMSSSSTTSTIGSLLASTLQRQKFGLGGDGGGLGLKDAPPQGNSNGFHGFDPYEEIQMGKDHVKMEENQNSIRMAWGGQNHHHHGGNGQNHMEQINSSSHDQSLMWNSTGVGGGAWLDPPNLGSSVPSLI